MLNYLFFRKFVCLGNGKRVMLRLLNGQDREAFTQLFQEASDEDARFLREDFKDQKVVNYWLDFIDYRQVLPLVAVDLEGHRFIANANIHRGNHAARHIGDIRIFVAEPFRELGLGSVMLEELINLALKENLHWLKAEVIADHQKVIKAFKSKGFETKAILEDYFFRKDGVTHNVALMMRPVLREEEKEF
jgi:L-amino acid N-acyltransferase YncA